MYKSQVLLLPCTVGIPTYAHTVSSRVRSDDRQTAAPPRGRDRKFRALDNAGTFGILTLFGIIPAAMAWSMRYTGDESVPLVPPVVPGGKLTLGAMTGGAVLVIGLEVAEKFGLLVT